MRIEDTQAWTLPQFVQHLGGAVEHSPWVAQRAWLQRPFASLDALADAMQAAIRTASPDEQLALLRAHPELAGREAAEGAMTPDSTGEQARLGLLSLDAPTLARLHGLNRRYRERFGFPFIVALRLHASLDEVLSEGERRLDHDPATERALALDQVGHVMRGRLARLFAPDTPPTAASPSRSFP